MRGPVFWLGEQRLGGHPAFRLGRTKNELVAEWPGICSFSADRATGVSEMTSEAGVDPLFVEKVHRGLAQALLRHLAGKLTLHASAVAFDRRAIACFGESESGKSTTMAHLSRLPGAEFFADDTLAIEFTENGIDIVPTEKLSWLRPEAHASLGHGDVTAKSPVSPPRAAATTARLASLVNLRFEEGAPSPRLRRLRGHDALSALVPSVVRFIIDEPAVQLLECEQLTSLVSAVPVFELTRARNLGGLEKSAELVLSLLSFTRTSDDP